MGVCYYSIAVTKTNMECTTISCESKNNFYVSKLVSKTDISGHLVTPSLVFHFKPF